MRLSWTTSPALALAGAITVVSGCSRPADPVPVVGSDITLLPDTEIIPARVPRHATFAGMLKAHDLSGRDVDAMTLALAGVFDLRRLREEQTYRLERTLDGLVRRFEYEIDSWRYLLVERRDDSGAVFEARVVPYETTCRPVVVEGEITRETPSLFGVIDAVGERFDLAVALADVFGGEVDFNTELQPGDRFSLSVDRIERGGELAGYGAITAAWLRTAGRVLEAVRFAPDKSAPSYYDPQGRSLKRFFLRSPLKFEPRISSGFSRNRFHPVLHEYRAHLGVDYRAPVGAPVVAVSSGVVTAAGWRGGGGLTVSVRHAGGYESSYLHLSSIAPGVRAGAHVSQGVLVGRVGATGLATGPHLDYRLKRDGRWVNPVAEHRRMPPGDPIPASEMDAFAAARDRARLSLPPPAASDALRAAN